MKISNKCFRANRKLISQWLYLRLEGANSSIKVYYLKKKKTLKIKKIEYAVIRYKSYAIQINEKKIINSW